MWLYVVEDRELVMGGSTVCAGSGKPGKNAKTTHAQMRTHETHLDNSRLDLSRRTQDAKMRLLVQVSLLETQGIENTTCHSTHEHISLCTPESAISLNYGKLKSHIRRVREGTSLSSGSDPGHDLRAVQAFRKHLIGNLHHCSHCLLHFEGSEGGLDVAGRRDQVQR